MSRVAQPVDPADSNHFDFGRNYFCAGSGSSATRHPWTYVRAAGANFLSNDRPEGQRTETQAIKNPSPLPNLCRKPPPDLKPPGHSGLVWIVPFHGLCDAMDQPSDNGNRIAEYPGARVVYTEAVTNSKGEGQWYKVSPAGFAVGWVKCDCLSDFPPPTTPPPNPFTIHVPKDKQAIKMVSDFGGARG